MKRLKIWLVFISLFALRWVSYPSPLPSDWRPDSLVGYTVRVLDEPEYTDSKTIVHSGIWRIVLKGYKEIIPGSHVRFEGTVEPKVVMGKVVQVVMREPKVEFVNISEKGEVTSEKFVILLGEWRERWVMVLQKTLPEPMASLSAGILLGVKGQMPQDFYQNLVHTGTLHIVAASGYNVTIVAAVIMKMTMMFVARGAAIGFGVFGIIIYVLISGGSASVIRAGIMGSLTLIAYYLGRPAEARRLLWVTAGLMLLTNPLMIVDIGFQLSFVATAGLLYLEPIIRGLKRSDPCETVGKGPTLGTWVHSFLSDYLFPTLAVTIATMPVILYHFGRVSLVSPLVNMLVLPVVPLIMGMTSLVIAFGSINLSLAQVFAWLVYVPLAWMVWVIQIFGKL